MEPEVQQEFEQMRALLRETQKWLSETALRQAQAELRMERAEEESAKRFARAEARMDRAEARMDRMEAQFAARHAKAEARMDRAEKQLIATRDLVRAGIRMVTSLTAAQRETDRKLQLFIDSMRRGSNGGRRN